MILVLLVVAIGLGLWWFFGQHNAASLDNLQASGFHADYTLDHNVSPVALDSRTRRIAFLGLTRVRIYDYRQVISWRFDDYENPGGNDRSEPQVHRELVFRLDDAEHPVVRLAGFDAEAARRWLATLQRELPQAGRGR